MSYFRYSNGIGSVCDGLTKDSNGHCQKCNKADFFHALKHVSARLPSNKSMWNTYLQYFCCIRNIRVIMAHNILISPIITFSTYVRDLISSCEAVLRNCFHEKFHRMIESTQKLVALLKSNSTQGYSFM